MSWTMTPRPYPLTAALAILALAWTPAGPLDASEQRGVEQVPIVDADGQEVLLYAASHALVIGIGDYTAGWPDLPGVASDVEAVSRVLEEHGFAVRREAGLDHLALDRVIRAFIAERGQAANARLVIYFAGHGHTLEQSFGGEMGYVVPADAPLPDRDRPGFVARALPMVRIQEYAKTIQSKHALFVFDSCFSGSIFALSRAAPRHISARTAQPVRQFITAGSADETVPDESLFRRQLVAALEGEGDANGDGYVTGAELGEYLYNTVVSYSDEAQHPQYGKIRDPRLDKGDFVFQLPAPPVPEVEGPPETTFELGDLEAEADQVEAARKAWETRLEEMQAALRRAEEFEGRPVGAARKVEAWQRFLSAFAADDPLSQKDDALRQRAAERLAHWRRQAAQPPLPPPRVEESCRSGEERTFEGIDFVRVCGGTFTMGSADDDPRSYSDEKPAHLVTLSEYWLGKYEVSNREYRRFRPDQKGEDDLPATNVSWNDAQSHCEKYGFRLPTEAEWEYAARAGSQAAWSFGDDESQLGDYAWYKQNSGGEAHQVGTRKPNGWGLHDLHGNVWEWVADWKAPYSEEPQIDPTGPAEGEYRVVRGGSFVDESRDLRSAYRGWDRPVNRGRDVGFRCVRSPRLQP